MHYFRLMLGLVISQIETVFAFKLCFRRFQEIQEIKRASVLVEAGAAQGTGSCMLSCKILFSSFKNGKGRHYCGCR